MTGHRPGSAGDPRAKLTRAVGARAARRLMSSAVAIWTIALVTTGALAATLVATMAPRAVQLAAASEAQPAQDASPGCTSPAHIAKDQIVIAVVADFGGVNGKILVTCVLVKPGVSGAQVLQAQAALLGYPSPRYAESGSGLLCAIDGYPTSGCGTEAGGHYAYWSYWHGGKRWQYANGGPGEWKVSKGDVEGWRFEPDGSATPADPPPRAASSAGALEAPARAAPTTTSSSPSGGHAAGPVGARPNSASSIPFVVSVAFILLIGAGALVRSRRASNRAT